MRTLLAGLMLSCIGLLSPSALAAEAAATPKGAYVVIVGVGETADATIKPRPTADADAKALYDLLADKKYFDAAPDRIKLLTSKADAGRKGLAATRENILAAVKDAVAKTAKDDLVVLAFFGRGASVGDNTCLIASDTTFKDRAKTGVIGTELETEFKAAKTQRLLVLMDVHFKGFDAGKDAIVEPTLRDILSGLYGGEEKAEAQAIQDRVLMLGAIPSVDPLAKGDNGLFASTLLDALRGKADVEGYEPDGLVTVDELVKYLEKEVADGARTLGKTPKEKEAVPFIVGEETSHFAITKNPELSEGIAKRLKALEALKADKKVTAEQAFEGAKLLSRMPKLKAIQELRKLYQSLADGKLGAGEFAESVRKIKASMVMTDEEAEDFTKKVMTAQRLVDSSFVKQSVPGDLVAAAVRGLYRRLEEPLPAEMEANLKGSKDWKKSKMEEALTSARVALGKREDLDGNKDADLAITMMLASLNDPYTTYYDKETIKKIESQLRGTFSGVGIQIRRDLVSDALLVASPIKNSPAYKAGIQSGDLIVGIKRDSDPEGKPLTSEQPTEFSTKGMKTETALDIILGKPGVPVTLVIQTPDGEKKDVLLKRGTISVETVMGTARIEGDKWSFWQDEKEKIGYIHLTQFTRDTIKDLTEALAILKKGEAKGLVLDLRFNPGGALEAAGAICSLFVKDGKVVSIRPRLGREDILKTSMFADFLGNDRYTDWPMAVLINGSSASASEIVSACLQDYNRAMVVGERSYGKGSVQNVRPFAATGAQIKMTTARYFPPGDRNIDKLSTGGKPDEEWGVKPDTGFEVALSKDEQRDLAELFRDREIIPRKDGKGEKKEKKEFKDRQLDKAVDYVKAQANPKK